jgi:cell division protein FtsI/penicillin-binding protein 2
VVVVEVKTGKILAMSQGTLPEKWGAKQHSALHELFPAASIFKTVATTAAIEVLDTNPNKMIGLQGGCGDVLRSGVWMREQKPKRHFQMSLRRAYGLSCNGYYAKLAVNQLGLGTIMHYANLYGWNRPLDADFFIPVSPIKAPDSRTASALTVGKFSAGFGYVGLNAAHAAWVMLTIARNGEALPLQLFADTVEKRLPTIYPKIIEPETAGKLRGLMDYSVRGGTAHFAFQSRKFWKVRRIAGGKTGTLTGDNPKGMTTWFTGLMPLESPEIAVAAVVILEDLWHIKGANLAAEAMYAYRRMHQKKKSLFHSNLAAKSEMKETSK